MSSQVHFGAAVVLLGLLAACGSVAQTGGSSGGGAGNDQGNESTGPQWAYRAAMPEARFGIAAGVLDGLIYVMGGDNGSGAPYSDHVDVYDPVSDSWSAAASLPAGRTDAASAVAGGKIYLIGGTGVGAAASVLAYDPEADAWTAVADLPNGQYLATATAVNGSIFVFGGGSNPVNGVQVYDPVSDAWSTPVAYLMPTPRYWTASVVLDNEIFVLGGANFNLHPALATVEGLQANDWTTHVPLPHDTYALGTAAVGSALYVAGGTDGGGTFGSVFKLAGANWDVQASLQTPRASHAMVTVEGSLYVLGGFGSDSMPLNSVERLNP